MSAQNFYEQIRANQEAARDRSDAPVESGDYDPADHKVEDVLAFVEANPDEAQYVLDMEQAGKNRAGIISVLAESD